MSAKNNLVLQAEPGAGKSTALPLSLLDAEWLGEKKILMLEPRRVAAKSIAHYLAVQLGEKVGQRIGYHIKNDRKASKDTRLEIVTEGILTRRLQSDPEIADIGLIIFDEFHLRSIHADLSLLLSLDIQQTIREDLKLLVMSATIDTQMIAAYMDGADIIECPGRTFPVTVTHATANNKPLVNQVIDALRTALTDSSGDILVFLPGQADIKRCIKESQNTFNIDPELLFLPLYGGLSLAQQEQALIPDPNGKKRIVFTTNIAETSLTIEGVTYVIDSGLEKILKYDPTSSMTRLETTYISKASATQRAGRAGRTQPGNCIRLWNEEKHRSLSDYQREEILSADLTGLILDLCLWGDGNFNNINWLTPPPKAHYDSAVETLASLELIDANRKITTLGEKAANIGLSPRLTVMLLKSTGSIEQTIAADLAALLAEKDIFQPKHGVDITERLLAVQEYKADKKTALNTYPIHRSSMEQLLISSRSFNRILNQDGSLSDSPKLSLSQLETIGTLLLYAFPDRLAKKRSQNSGRYQLANGRGVFLFEDDPLFNSDWLVIADCDAQRKEGRIYSAAPISYEAVKTCLGDKIEEKDHFEFDSSKQKIIGRRIIQYQAITLDTSAISDIPPDIFKECLSQVIRDCGFSILNWNAECDNWLSRTHWLGQQIDTFPKLSMDSLLESLDDWLLPYLPEVTSIAALKKVNIFDLLISILTWEEQQLLNQEAPTEYQSPSNKTVPIIYDEHQGPIVSIQLQEMFGQIESPKIGGGKTPIRFELLSPARRPIQTTSDLGNFWKTSYFDVAKEMKGRYPKHRWPDQPLLEKPGKSLKRR